MAAQKFDDQLNLSELEEIVLSVMSKTEPVYGLEIVRRISVGSSEMLEVGDGSLYPALRRLLKREYIAKASRPKREPIVATRKYYVLTEKGANQLKIKQNLRQGIIHWRTRDV